MLLKENGLKKLRVNKKKFIYLISPNKIKKSFYTNLKIVLSSNLVSFFQLRLKRYSLIEKEKIGKKIKKICKKYKVKLIVNDDPYLAKKIGADGCHLGQNDMVIQRARKILKKKIGIESDCNFKNRIGSNRKNFF